MTPQPPDTPDSSSTKDLKMADRSKSQKLQNVYNDSYCSAVDTTSTAKTVCTKESASCNCNNCAASPSSTKITSISQASKSSQVTFNKPTTTLPSQPTKPKSILSPFGKRPKVPNRRVSFDAANEVTFKVEREKLRAEHKKEIEEKKKKDAWTMQIWRSDGW